MYKRQALYILKTFGVEADGDIAELKALAKLLEGKKVPEIFAMADKVAQENNVNWASNAPPSPVSYTHLDVYKRQNYWCTCNMVYDES